MTESVDAFFTAPNEIDPGAVGTDASELLDRLVARLSTNAGRTILPARVEGATRWYGIASNGLQTRLLLEELQSWFGPPITPAVELMVTPRDAVDAAALAVLPGATVARIDVSVEWRACARENAGRLLDTWDLAPTRSGEPPRPVGRVLRQFYDALLARDRRSAELAVQEIQDRSLLSSTNIRFLRVELLASLGTAEELRDEPSLRDVSLLSRPINVTDYLAAAANELIIAPAFNGLAPDFSAIGRALEDQWPGLVAHPSQILSAAGARCLALVEASVAEPRLSVLAALRTLWGHDPIVAAVVGPEEPLVRSSTASTIDEPEILVDPPTAKNPLQLIADGEYAQAIEAIEVIEPDAALAAVAMHAALNLGDAGFDERALCLVERLDVEVRARLLAGAVERSFHEQLTARNGSEQVPHGWVEWLQGMGSDRPDLLRTWSSGWGSPTDLEASEVDAVLLGLIDSLDGERRARTRNGLPVLIDWILGTGGLQPATIPLAVTALDVVLESEPGPLERQAALELLDELLHQGCSAAEYAEIGQSIRAHLVDLGPRDAGWVAGCLDLLWISSCPNQSTRSAVTSEALGRVLAWGVRTDPLDHVLLTRVFAEAGVELPVRPADPADPTVQSIERSFRRVGIYSLHEASSRVASGWIESEWPGVKVSESHDHGNSERLEALVRGCDVVLVQTSRASHAATNAISAVGVDPSRVVLINGRGATALVRGLNSWARSA
jgi:hypothetical protein